MLKLSPDTRILHIILSALFGFALCLFMLSKAFPDEIGGLLHEDIPAILRNHIHDIVSGAIYSILAWLTLHYYKKARELERNRSYYTSAIAQGYRANFLSHVLINMPANSPPLLAILPPVSILDPSANFEAAFKSRLENLNLRLQDDLISGRTVTAIYDFHDNLLSYMDIVRTLRSVDVIIATNLGKRQGMPPDIDKKNRETLYNRIVDEFREELSYIEKDWPHKLKMLESQQAFEYIERLTTQNSGSKGGGN